MNAAQIRFENVWEVLLSREPKRIMAAYQSLSPDKKKTVLDHLEKMVSEPGWQPEQRISAQAALNAISKE